MFQFPITDENFDRNVSHFYKVAFLIDDYMNSDEFYNGHGSLSVEGAAESLQTGLFQGRVLNGSLREFFIQFLAYCILNNVYLCI